MALQMTTEEAGRSLAPMAEVLEADGYRLLVAVDGDVLRLDVEAGPEACEDCLVPLDLMRDMLAQQLRDDGFDVDPAQIALSYPADAH